MRGKRWLLWTPLVAFLLLLALGALGLFGLGNRPGTSRLVGQPMPAISLPAIVAGRGGFAPRVPGPRLVNVFASWCGPCEAEVAQLELLKRRGMAIDGIAIRDTPDALASFLRNNGNPYRSIGSDPESRAMITLGSSGVPESFVVDGGGIIRHHHVGAIGAQDVPVIIRAWRAAR